MKILLVEDNAVDVALFHHAVAKHHGVTVVGTAAEAIKTASREFDLIVCDYCVPGAYESALVDTLRKLYEDVPLVVLTGRADVRESVPKSSAGFAKLREIINKIERLSVAE